MEQSEGEGREEEKEERETQATQLWSTHGRDADPRRTTCLYDSGKFHSDDDINKTHISIMLYLDFLGCTVCNHEAC